MVAQPVAQVQSGAVDGEAQRLQVAGAPLEEDALPQPPGRIGDAEPMPRTPLPPSIPTPRLMPEIHAHRSELALQVGGGEVGHRSDAVETEGCEPGGDSRVQGQDAEWERGEEGGLLPGSDSPDVVRPRLPGGDLGHLARGGDTNGDIVVIEQLLDAAGDRNRPAGAVGMGGMPAGEVAPGDLVAHLDDGGEPVEAGEQLLAEMCHRHLVGGDEGGSRTALLGLTQRLARMDPGGPRRCRGGEDGQAELRGAADDHGLRAQLGMTAPGNDQGEVGEAGTEDAGKAHPATAGISVATAGTSRTFRVAVRSTTAGRPTASAAAKGRG